jgi:hypothetical protein
MRRSHGRGGALQVEMISEPVKAADPKDAEPKISGAARDDKGNGYKVAF